MSDESLTALIRRHGLAADKSLGQHFLVSGAVISRIVSAASGCAGVLEIGPGPGVLTLPLSLEAQVVAVETDPRMVSVASERAPLARVAFGDALQVSWSALLEGLPSPRAIVSNMPYNITGPLLERVCDCRLLIDRAVLMMQKEVGEKVLAPAGDSGRGSVSVVIQEAFEVSKLCAVPPGAFLPPPKVDSVVLVLVPRLGSLVSGRGFQKFVGVGFVSPRKKLCKALSALASMDAVLGVFAELGLRDDVRAHQVSGADWVRLFEGLGGNPSPDGRGFFRNPIP